MERFWNKVKKTEGCWEWIGLLKPNGYGWFSIGKRPINAHRMAWELTHGAIPPKTNVCHRCDNRRCVNPDHLWLGTQSENLLDMWRKGRGVSRPNPKRGEENYQAKLSWNDVRFIREQRGKLSQRTLAKMFGVCQQTVCEAQKGLTWKEGVSF